MVGMTVGAGEVVAVGSGCGVAVGSGGAACGWRVAVGGTVGAVVGGEGSGVTCVDGAPPGGVISVPTNAEMPTHSITTRTSVPQPIVPHPIATWRLREVPRYRCHQPCKRSRRPICCRGAGVGAFTICFPSSASRPIHSSIVHVATVACPYPKAVSSTRERISQQGHSLSRRSVQRGVEAEGTADTGVDGAACDQVLRLDPIYGIKRPHCRGGLEAAPGFTLADSPAESGSLYAVMGYFLGGRRS